MSAGEKARFIDDKTVVEARVSLEAEMTTRKRAKWAVHVTLDDYSKHRIRSIEDAITQSSLIKKCLEGSQTGWERPSADEAILITDASLDEGHDSLIGWAERLRDDIKKVAQMDASIGIASSRLAARIASRLARPRGLLLLLPGYESDFLTSVSLEELDELRSGQLRALRQKGLRTLGDLSDLEPQAARSLLGPEALKLISLIRGTDGPGDRASGDKLERAVGLLCRRVAKRLRDGCFGARGLELSLFYRDGVSLDRYTIVPRPARAARDLEPPALDLLRRFPQRQEPVVGMSLTATGLSHLPDHLPFFSRPRDVRVSLGRV
jgi:nucleotidyltransferase/DNA polymerase involved in DNA repair